MAYSKEVAVDGMLVTLDVGRKGRGALSILIPSLAQRIHLRLEPETYKALKELFAEAPEPVDPLRLVVFHDYRLVRDNAHFSYRVCYRRNPVTSIFEKRKVWYRADENFAHRFDPWEISIPQGIPVGFEPISMDTDADGRWNFREV